MASPSGTSVKGLQNLFMGNVPNPSGLFIKIGAQNLPPSRRVGYFFLYAVSIDDSNRCFVLDHGAVHTPGLYRKFSPVPLVSGSVFRLDVIWNESFLSWLLAFS